MSREIVLDTETTGLDPDKGDRIIEIGCVELMNHLPTGKVWHQYLNPERDVPPEVVAVHGITNEFLADKPFFAEVYSDFLTFIGADRLVIHNAEFDLKFLNAELRRVGNKPLSTANVLDTVRVAREKFPGSPASLDALCRRFGIDNSNRTYHGALLDSELLAEVYLELLGGRQQGLGLADFSGAGASSGPGETAGKTPRRFRKPRPHAADAEELAAHAALVEKLTDPLWKSAG